MTDADAGPGARTQTASHEGVSAELAPGPLAPGARIGRYVIERVIGAGGMGVVVEARDPGLERHVALKVVRPDIGDRAYRQRLVREARAMAQLEHPNVVRVYDAGEHEDEVFVAMELVRGQSLGAWLRAGRRPWREVVARFVEAGRGLAAAHAAGMVHRDFKPDNVLVRDADSRVCVTDFGLAVPAGARELGEPAEDHADDDAPHVSGVEVTLPAGSPSRPSGRSTPRATADLTATGAAVGTPPYMAPEQHRGAEVDPRADVFSFCVSLYEGVYGERPFAIDAAARDPVAAWSAAIAEGRVRPPPPGRRVPAALRRALVRGLASDPAARWPSMEPLLAVLARVLARRRRVAIVAIAAGSLAAVGGAIAFAARSPAATVDACARDAGAAAAIWSEPQRAAVRAHATALAAPPLITTYDHWAESWRDLRSAQCRAAAAGALAQDEWRGREVCFDHLLAQFRARIALVVEPDFHGWSVPALLALPEPSQCAFGEHEALPADPRARAEIEVVQRLVDGADALRAAGSYHEAWTQARALLPRARATGWGPLVDQVALEVADLDLINGRDVEEAEHLAREVAVNATARGADPDAAEAWRYVLSAKSSAGHFDGLDDVVASARAAAARMHSERDQQLTEREVGGLLREAGRLDDARAACQGALARAAPGPVRAELLACLSEIESDAGRFTRARELQEQYLAEQLAFYGPRTAYVLNALTNIAVGYDHEGRDRDALIVRLTAHALILARSGADSPDAGDSWDGVALSYAELGDADGARDAIAHGAEIAARLPDDDARRLQARSTRAYVLDAIGDHDAALAEYLSLEPTMARVAPASTEHAVVAINAAQALSRAGRCKDVVTMLDRVLAQTTGKLEPTMSIFLEASRDDCRIELGDAAGAVRDLDRAWRAIDPAELGTIDRGAVELALARGLVRTGDRARARDLARAARADLAANHEPEVRAQLDAVDAALGGAR